MWAIASIILYSNLFLIVFVLFARVTRGERRVHLLRTHENARCFVAADDVHLCCIPMFTGSKLFRQGPHATESDDRRCTCAFQTWQTKRFLFVPADHDLLRQSDERRHAVERQPGKPHARVPHESPI